MSSRQHCEYKDTTPSPPTQALLELDLDFGGSYLLIVSAIDGLKLEYHISALAKSLTLL